VFSGNQLTGAILLGDRTSGSWYGELIESGADISQQKAEMMFGREFSRIV
jgi:nitrite reductase (NADH) large subunit